MPAFEHFQECLAKPFRVFFANQTGEVIHIGTAQLSDFRQNRGRAAHRFINAVRAAVQVRLYLN